MLPFGIAATLWHSTGMPAMKINVNPQMADFIEAQVKSGRYASADDVVNGALLRLQGEQVFSGEELEELRAEVAIGIEEANRSDVAEWDPDDLKRRVRKHVV